MSENNMHINDLLIALKNLENNDNIKFEKNLTKKSEKCALTKAIIECIIMISSQVLITERGLIDEENVHHLNINGFLTFPMVINNLNEWCDIVICTKKGQIRMA